MNVSSYLPMPVRSIGPARLLAGTENTAGPVRLDEHRRIHGDRRQVDRSTLQSWLETVRLLGRGGAAFPVGRKLASLAHAGHAVVVVNGSEGEPASYKDRALLCHVPHLVLDGALAVADAVGAETVEVDVHDATATAAVQRAAGERTDRARIRISHSPTRFVSGEATATVSRLGGGSGVPDGRRTLPTSRGVQGRPTFLSNVETFAQIALVVQHGPDAYLTTGIADEPGTSLFTVTGAVSAAGVVEAPTGIPLSVLLGSLGATEPAAVLIGGYHGGWWSGDHPYGYQVGLSRPGLRALGASLGAGSLSVLPTDTCPIGETARVAHWLAGESIGQCGPCVFGLPSLATDLDRLLRGDQTRRPDLQRNLAILPGRGACAHPDGAVRFVTSALAAFPADLDAHRRHATCGRPVRRILPLTDHVDRSATRPVIPTVSGVAV